MTPFQPRDSRWFPFMRFAALRTGVRMGVLLSLVLTVWLILANRVGVLERFAIIRNAAALALVLLIAFEPVARFRNSARNLVLAGGIGWAIGSLCYLAWTMYFSRLALRMGAFHIFVLGAAVYGLVAVLVWLTGLVRAAHHHHVAESKLRHRTP